MQYLFLTDLPHGKLVNLRTERVDHEFVNNVLTRADRTEISIDCEEWQEMNGGRLKDRAADLLADWGTGLDLGLYEEAVAYLCEPPPEVETEVEIRFGEHMLGTQRMRLASPGVAIRITALAPEWLDDLQNHLYRLLNHADLHAIQWINITRPLLRFKTLRKGK